MLVPTDITGRWFFCRGWMALFFVKMKSASGEALFCLRLFFGRVGGARFFFFECGEELLAAGFLLGKP